MPHGFVPPTLPLEAERRLLEDCFPEPPPCWKEGAFTQLRSKQRPMAEMPFSVRFGVTTSVLVLGVVRLPVGPHQMTPKDFQAVKLHSA